MLMMSEKVSPSGRAINIYGFSDKSYTEFEAKLLRCLDTEGTIAPGTEFIRFSTMLGDVFDVKHIALALTVFMASPDKLMHQEDEVDTLIMNTCKWAGKAISMIVEAECLEIANAHMCVLQLSLISLKRIITSSFSPNAIQIQILKNLEATWNSCRSYLPQFATAGWKTTRQLEITAIISYIEIAPVIECESISASDTTSMFSTVTVRRRKAKPASEEMDIESERKAEDESFESLRAGKVGLLLIARIKSGKRNLRCPLCRTKEATFTQMKNHIETQHIDVTGDFNVSIVGDPSKMKGHFYSSKLINVGELFLPLVGCNDNSMKIFQCPFCKFKLGLHSMRKHIRKFHDALNSDLSFHPNDIAGNQIYYKSSIESKYVAIYRGVDFFQCPACDAREPTLKGLVSHLQCCSSMNQSAIVAETMLKKPEKSKIKTSLKGIKQPKQVEGPNTKLIGEEQQTMEVTDVKPQPKKENIEESEVVQKTTKELADEKSCPKTKLVDEPSPEEQPIGMTASPKSLLALHPVDDKNIVPTTKMKLVDEPSPEEQLTGMTASPKSLLQSIDDKSIFSTSATSNPPKIVPQNHTNGMDSQEAITSNEPTPPQNSKLEVKRMIEQLNKACSNCWSPYHSIAECTSIVRNTNTGGCFECIVCHEKFFTPKLSVEENAFRHVAHSSTHRKNTLNRDLLRESMTASRFRSIDDRNKFLCLSKRTRMSIINSGHQKVKTSGSVSLLLKNAQIVDSLLIELLERVEPNFDVAYLAHLGKETIQVQIGYLGYLVELKGVITQQLVLEKLESNECPVPNFVVQKSLQGSTVRSAPPIPTLTQLPSGILVVEVPKLCSGTQEFEVPEFCSLSIDMKLEGVLKSLDQGCVVCCRSSHATHECECSCLISTGDQQQLVCGICQLNISSWKEHKTDTKHISLAAGFLSLVVAKSVKTVDDQDNARFLKFRTRTQKSIICYGYFSNDTQLEFDSKFQLALQVEELLNKVVRFLLDSDSSFDFTMLKRLTPLSLSTQLQTLKDMDLLLSGSPDSSVNKLLVSRSIDCAYNLPWNTDSKSFMMSMLDYGLRIGPEQMLKESIARTHYAIAHEQNETDDVVETEIQKCWTILNSMCCIFCPGCHNSDECLKAIKKSGASWECVPCKDTPLLLYRGETIEKAKQRHTLKHRHIADVRQYIPALQRQLLHHERTLVSSLSQRTKVCLLRDLKTAEMSVATRSALQCDILLEQLLQSVLSISKSFDLTVLTRQLAGSLHQQVDILTALTDRCKHFHTSDPLVADAGELDQWLFSPTLKRVVRSDDALPADAPSEKRGKTIHLDSVAETVDYVIGGKRSGNNGHEEQRKIQRVDSSNSSENVSTIKATLVSVEEHAINESDCQEKFETNDGLEIVDPRKVDTAVFGKFIASIDDYCSICRGLPYSMKCRCILMKSNESLCCTICNCKIENKEFFLKHHVRSRQHEKQLEFYHRRSKIMKQYFALREHGYLLQSMSGYSLDIVYFCTGSAVNIPHTGNRKPGPDTFKNSVLKIASLFRQIRIQSIQKDVQPNFFSQFYWGIRTKSMETKIEYLMQVVHFLDVMVCHDQLMKDLNSLRSKFTFRDTLMARQAKKFTNKNISRESSSAVSWKKKSIEKTRDGCYYHPHVTSHTTAECRITLNKQERM